MWDVEYRCLYQVQQDYNTTNLRVARYNDAATHTFTNYLGFPILNMKPDYNQDIEWTYARTVYIQDWTLGQVRQTTWDSAPQNIEKVDYFARSRERVRNFFAFLNAVRGRWKPFWRLTTGDDDILISQTMTAGSFYLVISAPDYQRFYNLISSRLDIAVSDVSSGTVAFATRITDVSSFGGGTYQITLQDPLPLTIQPQPSRYHVSFLRFARMASDVIEVQWPRHDVAFFSFTVQDLQYGTTSYT
jgi:hypothetical protein